MTQTAPIKYSRIQNAVRVKKVTEKIKLSKNSMLRNGYDYDSIMVMVSIIFVLGTYHSEDSFDLNEDHTPELAKGEILCRALFLSVDPITSLYMKYGMSFGETFPGRQVARIVESRNKDFLKGKVLTNLDGKSDGQTK